MELASVLLWEVQCLWVVENLTEENFDGKEASHQKASALVDLITHAPGQQPSQRLSREVAL